MPSTRNRRRRTSIYASLGTLAVALPIAALLTDRAPYPYSQRRLLDVELPYLTNKHLERQLEPRSGQRILEVGPGTGLQTMHVARRLGDAGRLDVVDIQADMIDHIARECARRNLTNVHPMQADATALPFDDNTFDSVYMMTVLGEIPAAGAAVREISRVLKPNGTLVVGEFLDRHWISRKHLTRIANAAGLHEVRRHGRFWGYTTAFRAS
ncbi:class I SAM-dependent methyltransferase [Prescottella agglutinans]|uniref:class I SAM-dependent methyltransferase n=1 Tax=Prescottella agglutinans TaxID=1644129 RepID=UPI003CC8DE2A